MTEERYKQSQELLKEIKKRKASLQIIDKILQSENIECLVNSRDWQERYITLGHSLRMSNCNDLLRKFLEMDRSTINSELINLEKEFELL